ncbi:hypothetical protein JTB14_013999 [Gonioctena quinquepunctata]|nr:hypothetical protein JTB14_013999 [Gonioctena quinquepunctata]
MRKKNIQHIRNIKRRKTEKTHEEIELDNKDCQKAGKPDVNKNLYPKVIIQTDGPSGTDNILSPSSKEDLLDLSMRKKNIQHIRNIKRRKTEKTHEEIELDNKDCQKAGKPDVKSMAKDKNKEKLPNQEQKEQPLQGRNKKALPPPTPTKIRSATQWITDIITQKRTKLLSEEKVWKNKYGNIIEELDPHNYEIFDLILEKNRIKNIEDEQKAKAKWMEYEEYLADNPDLSSSERDSKLIELARSSDFGGNQSSDEHEKNPDSPTVGRQTGNEYEDEYFTHLSNADSEDDMEHSSVDFRKTEEILGQIAQQKNS